MSRMDGRMIKFVLNHLLKRNFGLTYNDLEIQVGKRKDSFYKDQFSNLSSLFNVSSGGEMPVATACIDILTDSIAGSDMQVVVNTGNERSPQLEPQRDHPLKLLLDNPFKEWDTTTFWTWYFRELFHSGNAYAYIRRNGNRGRPVELIPARPTAINSDNTRNLHLFQNGKWRYMNTKVSLNNILDLHLNSFDGGDSRSPIARASSVINLIDSILIYNRNTIQKGLHFKTALITEPEAGDVNKKQREEIREALEKYSSGSDSAGKFLLLPKGLTPVDLSRLNAADMQIMNILQWGIVELCRIWRVPPRMVFHAEAGKAQNKQSIEAEGEDFYRNTLAPHFKRAESGFCNKLLTREEKVGNYRVVLSADELRQGSWTDKARIAQLLVTRGGLLTINEGRAILGKEPLEDGDTLINPTGTTDQGFGSTSLEGGGVEGAEEVANRIPLRDTTESAPFIEQALKSLEDEQWRYDDQIG